MKLIPHMKGAVNGNQREPRNVLHLLREDKFSRPRGRHFQRQAFSEAGDFRGWRPTFPAGRTAALIRNASSQKGALMQRENMNDAPD